MTTPADTIEVESLDMFVRLLQQWHSSKVKVLEHMLEIPTGTEADFEGLGKVNLVGDVRNGFIMGLSLALMELGTLPFVSDGASASPTATADAAAA